MYILTCKLYEACRFHSFTDFLLLKIPGFLGEAKGFCVALHFQMLSPFCVVCKKKAHQPL